jgi:hypothetical protein
MQENLIVPGRGWLLPAFQPVMQHVGISSLRLAHELPDVAA